MASRCLLRRTSGLLPHRRSSTLVRCARSIFSQTTVEETLTGPKDDNLDALDPIQSLSEAKEIQQGDTYELREGKALCASSRGAKSARKRSLLLFPPVSSVFPDDESLSQGPQPSQTPMQFLQENGPRSLGTVNIVHTGKNPTGKYDEAGQSGSAFEVSPPGSSLNTTAHLEPERLQNPTGQYTTKMKKLRFSYLMSDSPNYDLLVDPLTNGSLVKLSPEQQSLVIKMLSGRNIYFTGELCKIKCFLAANRT